MRENFTDFATSTITGSMTSGSSSFSVSSGQGSAFPGSNFLVSIDAEVMLISSRSGDTFTIQTRGFDGTTAASHSNGATVQCAICAYNLSHIWQNVADTYVPEVPPFQLGSSAGSADNEFESQGSWTLSPSPSGSTVFSVGAINSHLVFQRQIGTDTGRYTAYTSFTPGGAFTVTARVSQAVHYDYASGNTVSLNFFVSDQTNPTGGTNSGNNIRIETVYTATWSSSPYYWLPTSSVIRAASTSSGTGTASSPNVPITPGGPLYMRIIADGSGHYYPCIGDGITYSRLQGYAGISFTVRSVGFIFQATGGASSTLQHVVAIDYVRSVSSQLNFYGG